DPPPDGQGPYGQAPYGQAPYGQPPYSQPPYGQAPYGQPPYGQTDGQTDGQWAYPAPSPGHGADPAQHRDPDRRPLTVTIASVLTWIGAGATATLMLAFVAILAVGGDSFVREFESAAQRSNVTLTANQAMAVGWTVAAVFLVWSIAAIVLAVLAFRRNNAARIALVVSSVMTALFSLFGIASGISAITLVISAATVVLLFTGGANEWYSRRSRGGSPPPGTYAAPAQPAYPPPAERTKPW
ncbi:MAG: hypothetical protein QOK15_944, partial [Nocardioidaceae bacterium]|nr:hypothetical protein [Nocardioidaceae bacterium]